MALSLTRLTPTIGALVEGFDMAEPLSAEDQREVADALAEHHVLFFRNQRIDPLQHREFASKFGSLHVHPIYPSHPQVPEIMVLDTDVVDLKDNAIWHTDVTFSPTPPMGAVLAARVLPPQGGDTLWASCVAAFDGLSAPLQRFLEGLTASHDIQQSFPAQRFALDAEGQARLDLAKRNNPPVSHPVVRTHPVTGRKGLFVQEGFTTHINELSPLESRAILAMLYAHTIKPEYTVRWKWRIGDVAFWDNRVTQHYAVDDYRPARRVMHRATILGDRPR
jgi:taurine dioxygenase